MSVVVTFEIKTSINSSEVLNTLSDMWKYERAEITPNIKKGTVYITLSYYYAHDLADIQKEQTAIRNIMRYLLSIAADGKLYYFRDGLGDYPDYERPITVDELFTEEFDPSIDTRYYWRYLISPH